MRQLDLGCCGIRELRLLAGIDWKNIRELELWGNNIDELLQLRYLDLKNVTKLKLSRLLAT